MFILTSVTQAKKRKTPPFIDDPMCGGSVDYEHTGTKKTVVEATVFTYESTKQVRCMQIPPLALSRSGKTVDNESVILSAWFPKLPHLLVTASSYQIYMRCSRQMNCAKGCLPKRQEGKGTG
jgi:hypothetical protein